MKPRLAGALVAALLGWTASAFAGEAVTAFQPGKLPPEALPHLTVKAVVAEFLDPDRTGLGKEVSIVVFREILTALSDQAGAGVILAHPPGETRLVDLLRQNYHEAAMLIAKSQNARMAIWGAVSELDGRFAIDTYLSLIGEVVREDLALRLRWSEAPGRKLNDTGLSARITRTRFNFPRVWVTREQLFERPLRVQAETAVRDQPDEKSGKVLARVRVNDTLQATGMRGEWFQVNAPGGATGYVRAWSVYVPPRQIEARTAEPILSTPAAGSNPISTAAVGAKYAVQGSRYVDKSGLWYQVRSPAGPGWVRAFAMRETFTFPVVHFTAGLYRYQLGRYADAAREFERFTQLANAAADPPSLSTAYQMLGASRLMEASKERKILAGANVYEQALQQAIAVTPFDAGAYTLRAVATLAVQESASRALADITKALEYDPSNRDARSALDRLNLLSKSAPSAELPPMLFRRDFQGASGASLRKDIDSLSLKYSAVPLSDATARELR
jgi:tetratricopeptide (TPR) repeat protein